MLSVSKGILHVFVFSLFYLGLRTTRSNLGFGKGLVSGRLVL